MSDNDLSRARFAEHLSSGPGAAPTNPTRATRQLTPQQAADCAVAGVLGP